MKKIAIISCLIVCFVFTNHNSYAQNRQKALKYYQKLMEPISPVKRSAWLYLKEVSNGLNVTKSEELRLETIKLIAKAKEESKKSESYFGDKTLKEKMMLFLDTVDEVMSVDFKILSELEGDANTSYGKMESYILGKQKSFLRIKHVTQKLVSKQRSFSKLYKIGPAESMGDKTYKSVVKISQPFFYYNEIYLVFFKVYKQESLAWKAMKKEDLEAFKSHNELLLQYANEGLATLEKMKPYNEDDNSLLLAAKDILTYYQTEAKTTFPSLFDFYPKKKTYLEAKKLIDTKPEAEQTNDDINAYNTAANAYNKAVKHFNNVNSTAKRDRKKRLDMWNLRVDNFFVFYMK